MKKLAFGCLLLVSAFFANAQKNEIDSLTLDSLKDMELRLDGLGETMITSTDEQARLSSGYHFVKNMVRALLINHSYQYRFDSLKNVSVLYSPDNYFRIITWNLALNDETFRNYGVIQLNPEMTKKLKDTTNLKPFYPLIDRSDSIRNALDTTVSNEFWYGALYYKIIMTKYKKQTYYTLLGWDGKNKMTNVKLADVLYFENNQPRFGAPIFKMNDARYKKNLKRMVWEFNNNASMLLRYEEKKGFLVYENVAPSRPQDYGKPETYVPDGTYDFMLFNKKTGCWEKQKGMLSDFNME